jgi:hypothetical protein
MILEAAVRSPAILPAIGGGAGYFASVVFLGSARKSVPDAGIPITSSVTNSKVVNIRPEGKAFFTFHAVS